MSTTLVALSPDLSQLVDEGFDVEIREGDLLVHHIPYVTSEGKVAYGILACGLATNGERTITPERHEVWLVGGIPYDHGGSKISIIADENEATFGGDVKANCRLSGKKHNQPPADYYEKITTYVDVLGRFARGVDLSATYRDFPVRELSESESVFRYHDAASSRAALSAVTAKLKVQRVAIIGLGGTGSYILDLIAKTPIGEIHLYDDDEIYAHNAFRAPGAMPLDDLRESPKKVEYLAGVYEHIRRGIVAHPAKVTDHNVDELRDTSFVFLSMDAGPAKRMIVEQLIEWEIPFVDCGMGITRIDDSLRGAVRVTTAVPGVVGHVGDRISFTDVDADEYAWNIQTADLNMLNAAMAVLKWKKLCGYYVDRKREFNSSYVIASNQLISGDLPL